MSETNGYNCRNCNRFQEVSGDDAREAFQDWIIAGVCKKKKCLVRFLQKFAKVELRRAILLASGRYTLHEVHHDFEADNLDHWEAGGD